jgi:hypothetical protein
MPRGPRKLRLNIFLMKEGTSAAEVVRDDVAGLARAAISAGFISEVRLSPKGGLQIPRVGSDSFKLERSNSSLLS